MPYIYNSRSQSISMPMSYAGFVTAHGDRIGVTGNSLQATIGDRSHYGVYRHEFAHFASYNATGLMEFHSLFLEYRLYLHQRFMFFCLKKKGHPPIFPIIHRGSAFEPEACSAFQAANEQVRAIESYLFGYTTNKSVKELFDWSVQESFLRLIGDNITMDPSVQRTRMVYHQIVLTIDPDVAGDPKIMHPLVSDLDDPNGEPLRITSRAVLEAYAIAVEVVAKYRKAVVVDPEGPLLPPVRRPARIDTIALEACFDLWPERTFDFPDFLAGRAPKEVYWCVSLVTYAAMIVPVVADPAGDTCVMGSLRQLSVAQRFAHLLFLIENGTVRHPKETHEPLACEGGGDPNTGIRRWLVDALQAIGDPWSIKMGKRVANFVMSGGIENHDMVAPRRSQDEITKIARCELHMDPYGFISEGGIFSSASPNYLITSDKYVLANMASGDQSLAFFHYVNDSALELLELMIDHDSWDITWDRLAVADNRRKHAFAAILAQMCGKDNAPDLHDITLLF